jgi:hypothetical protein
MYAGVLGSGYESDTSRQAIQVRSAVIALVRKFTPATVISEIRPAVAAVKMTVVVTAIAGKNNRRGDEAI